MINKLINTVDNHYLTNKKKDLKYIISKEELIDIIGIEQTLDLLNIIETSYPERGITGKDLKLNINIRRIEPDINKAQHFHLDCQQRKSKIMQIPLNKHIGGKTIYALNDGAIIPERNIGDIYIHTDEIVHGVTELKEGTRYSLFIQYYIQDNTRSSEQNKVIKEIGSSLDIANHYLSLNNNDSDKAIEQYYNDK